MLTDYSSQNYATLNVQSITKCNQLAKSSEKYYQ